MASRRSINTTNIKKQFKQILLRQRIKYIDCDSEDNKELFAKLSHK